MIFDDLAPVWVVLDARGTPSADRALLAAEAARQLGIDFVEVTRRCENCGSTEHGRPVAQGAPALQLSLSRAEATVAIAVSFAGPLGVDIELADSVARQPIDDVAFSPAERSALDSVPPDLLRLTRAAMWTAKEAAAKALGTGLRRDPRTIEVGVPSLGDPVRWPPANGLHITSFDAGGGLVGSVAVLGEHEHPLIIVDRRAERPTDYPTNSRDV